MMKNVESAATALHKSQNPGFGMLTEDRDLFYLIKRVKP